MLCYRVCICNVLTMAIAAYPSLLSRHTPAPITCPYPPPHFLDHLLSLPQRNNLIYSQIRHTLMRLIILAI